MNLPALPIGFIGAGRLGTALAWALHGAGLRVQCVANTTAAKAQALAAGVPGCEVVDAQAVADRCGLVFITTADSGIAGVARSLRWRAGQSVVHCSGATEVEVLAPAQAQGAHIGGFHPLQVFTDPMAALQSLPGSTVTIEAQEPLDATLLAIAAGLGCRVNRLPPGMRGRYHAAAGYASHFINGVFAQAAGIWASWGASEDEALRALLPLASGALQSMASRGIAQGMPGPVARGDVESVRRHLQALAPLGPDVVDAYRVLCAATIPLALAQGGIDEATAQRLRGLLAARESHAPMPPPP